MISALSRRNRGLFLPKCGIPQRGRGTPTTTTIPGIAGGPGNRFIVLLVLKGSLPFAKLGVRDFRKKACSTLSLQCQFIPSAAQPSPPTSSAGPPGPWPHSLARGGAAASLDWAAQSCCRHSSPCRAEFGQIPPWRCRLRLCTPPGDRRLSEGSQDLEPAAFPLSMLRLTGPAEMSSRCLRGQPSGSDGA